MSKNTHREGLQSPDRRRFLKASGAGAATATLGGCGTLDPHGMDEWVGKSAPVITLVGAEQDKPKFDLHSVKDNLRFSWIPAIYEIELMKGSTPEAARTHAIGAYKMMNAQLPKEMAGAEFEIFRHKNTTAVVAYFPSRNQIKVAYDPTGELADKIEAYQIYGSPHPLGGAVHTGYANAIARKNEQGTTISDRVRAQVEAYAARSTKPVDLIMTGYSRGGTLSFATAAEWLAKEMPANTRLRDIQRFGSPEFGDPEFNKGFMKAVQKHGANITHIVAGNDKVAGILSKDLFGRDMYVNAGDIAYLLPNNQGVEILINPDADTMKRKVEPYGNDWHGPHTYATLMGEGRLPTWEEQFRKQQNESGRGR